MNIHDIYLDDDDDLRRMDEIAEAGENPAALIKIADIRPLDFARFLVDTGRAASPNGLLMWGLSLARTTVLERQARALAGPIAEAVSTGLVVGGIHGANTALRRRSWTAGLLSLVALGGGLGYRLSRLGGRHQPRSASELDTDDSRPDETIELVGESDLSDIGERALEQINRGEVIMRP